MRRGFSLIELLVVIAVIAILSSIVLVGLNGTQNVSHDDRRIADLNQVESDLETYFSECGFYPGPAQVTGSCTIPFNTPPTVNTWALMATSLKGSSAVRVSTVPNDPVKGRTYYYGTNSDGSSYIIGAQMDSVSSTIFKNYVPPPDLASYNAQGLTSCNAPMYCQEFLFSGGSQGTYNCVSNKCVAVVGNGGQFTSKASCSAVCGVVAGYPPTITSLTEETLTVTVPFSYNITATNCSPICNYGATGLPSWLTFKASTGLLSGTPKVAGTYPMTITASNGTATSSETLTLTVNNVDAPSLNDLSISINEKTALNYAISASNCDVAPCTYTATNLPTWVVFDGVQTLTGTSPASTGTYTAKLTASNAGGIDTETLTISVVSSTGIIIGGNGTLGSSPFFGVSINKSADRADNEIGLDRFWDSTPYRWADFETNPGCKVKDLTCAGGYDTTKMSDFDAYLKSPPLNSNLEALYTMAYTPNFASAYSGDTGCNGPANGDCDRPKDLNADGTGSDQYFRQWYAFFATHEYNQWKNAGQAHIRYWEVWNEPDTQAFWGNGASPEGLGSYDDLVRLTQDTECIIVGHIGLGTGPQTVSATGESCATVQASVGLSAPVDPSAYVISPSYHPKGAASMDDFQNYLYCSSGSPANCGNGGKTSGADSLQVINMHMKPGQGCVASGNNCTTATQVESTYTTYINNIIARLATTEKNEVLAGTIPIFDDEADYQAWGFADQMTPSCSGDPYSNPEMEESYLARFLAYGLSLGVAENSWYNWDKVCNPTNAKTAWNRTYDWLIGSNAGPGMCTPYSASTNIYTCKFSKGTTSYEMVWDISQSCSGTTPSTCSTKTYTPGGSWTSYTTLDAGTKTNFTGSFPLGVQPVLLQ